MAGVATQHSFQAYVDDEDAGFDNYAQEKGSSLQLLMCIVVLSGQRWCGERNVVEIR